MELGGHELQGVFSLVTGKLMFPNTRSECLGIMKKRTCGCRYLVGRVDGSWHLIYAKIIFQ